MYWTRMDFFCLPVDIKHWTFISNLIMFYSGSFFFLISVKSKVDVKVLGWRKESILRVFSGGFVMVVRRMSSFIKARCQRGLR